MAGSTDDLQHLVNKVHTTSDKFGLRVSSTKTEVHCIKERQEMKITLGNNELVQCEDFIYLGGVISQDSTCDKDVARRIGLAAGIVRNLGKVWKAKDINKATKVLLYQTLIQSVISHNSETWTLKEEHKRKLRVFEMSVLRMISGVTTCETWTF